MSFLTNLFHIDAKAQSKRDAAMTAAYRTRMHWEAAIGGALFGPVGPGGRREFFCLDEHTWIWHEAWQDEQGKHAVTTRYDVRPDGVFKTQGSAQAQPLDDTEAHNLLLTIGAYCDKIVGYPRPAQA